MGGAVSFRVGNLVGSGSFSLTPRRRWFSSAGVEPETAPADASPERHLRERLAAERGRLTLAVACSNSLRASLTAAEVGKAFATTGKSGVGSGVKMTKLEAP